MFFYFWKLSQRSLKRYHPEFLKHESALCRSTPPGRPPGQLCFLLNVPGGLSWRMFQQVRDKDWETLCTFARLHWFNRLPRRLCQSNCRRAYFHMILSLRPQINGCSGGAEPLTDLAASVEDFFSLSCCVICISPKSPNPMHPIFHSIPALPLAWFNAVALIYAVCRLSVGS